MVILLKNNIHNSNPRDAIEKSITLTNIEVVFNDESFISSSSSKNSPQNLHFIASSCISSAQKGHVFIKLKFRY